MPRSRERRESATPDVEHTSRPRGEDSPTHVSRRGKAPPVDPFNGESPELHIDDWLPNLERASVWNGWTDEEVLLLFAICVVVHS